MKVFFLSFCLLIIATISQAQQEPVLDTVAVLNAQKALEEAEILYSTEHVNYAKAALELSCLYMQVPDLVGDWEDIALESLSKIRQVEGAESAVYKKSVAKLPSPLDRLFDSQLALEEAEATQEENPALYVEQLFWRAKVFIDNDDLESYELITLGMKILAKLPPNQQQKLLNYAKKHIDPYKIELATSQAAVDKALSAPITDSLRLAELMGRYGAAVLAHEEQFPDDYLYLDSAYLRLTQALAIYEQKLGKDSPAYEQTYQTFTPLMARYYELEQAYFERLRTHQTNDEDFIVLFRELLQMLYDHFVPTYEEFQLFEWTLRAIKEQHGTDNPYYKIIKSIETNWELSAEEREIAIQQDLVQAYKKEYGSQGRSYLEALIKLGNLYADYGDDPAAEEVFHQAFDQLNLMDEQGVLPPTGDGTLLQYYWASVIPTWRVVLIQEHNLYIMQQIYGLQSAQYWDAYFKLMYEYHNQNILASERGEVYLANGITKIPQAQIEVAIPWLDSLFRLDPEFYIDPIRYSLPKKLTISQLESLLEFSKDSLQRQYSAISVEMGKLLEVMADAYFYDTTRIIHAEESFKRYQEILEIYQKVGDDYAYTELLDRLTQNLTKFSPWSEERVSAFFDKLIKIKEEDGNEEENARYFLKYIERYANWLYESEQLVASEQYFERIARYFEREHPEYLTGANNVKANDWYLRTLDKLASIYRKTGRYFRSKGYYQKLYTLAPQLSASFDEGVWKVVNATNNIGDLLYRAQVYDNALKAFELGLENMEKFKKDLPIFDTYKEKKSAILYVNLLQNKGRVYFELEEYAQARLYFKEALDFVNNPSSPISLDEMGTLMVNLAGLAVYDYEDEKAEQYYTRALTVLTDKEALAQAHLAFADYYQVTYRDSLAASHLLQALDIDLKRVQQNYTTLSEKERLLFLKPILKRFDIFIEFAIQYNNPDLLLKAFNSHLIIKGLSLETTNNLQSLCNITENIPIRNKCLEMQRLRKELSASIDLPAEVQNNLDRRITELEKEIGYSSKDLRAAYDKNNRNLDFVDIKRLLYNMNTPDSTTMAIDFLIVPEEDDNGIKQAVYYAAIVIPRHPYPHFVRLATTNELADVLATDVTPANFNYITSKSESEYLYQLVWEPLLPYIKDAQYLHLCPTGLLSRIAFGTLQTGEIRYRRVMDKWSIHYYGALRDLLQLKADNGPAANASALLVGGVKFDLTKKEWRSLMADNPTRAGVPMEEEETPELTMVARGEDFNYLPGTLEEVMEISKLFPNDWVVKLLSGVLATEENLTAIANESPDILHIATHGYFFPTPPENSPKIGARANKKSREDDIAASSNPLLRSGLALTGINRVWKGGDHVEGLEDGILTALEVSNLDLFNTKLVVLSACETGRGDIDNTEGILGLRRAFKIAGAQQLIISLWKVPDAQTSELMQLFYAKYLSGTSVHSAFEYAQKKMSQRYDNPYYWAAFLLIE
jgi:CHAT domain-containing protein